jgi:hypothetical protein
MIVSGKRTEFIMLLLSLGLLYFAIWLSKNKRTPEIKHLPALDALDEAVGRAAEMGKPVWYGTGMHGLDGQYTVMNICGMAILGKVAEYAGKYGAYLQYFTSVPHMVPIARDLIKEGYQKGGRAEMFNEDMGRFVGGGQMNLIRTSYAYMMRERPAACLMFGALLSECQSTLGWAANIDTMILAGTPRLYYQAQLVLVCDYQLLGEELYTAGAILSGDPTELGVVEGQDWIKLVVLLLMFISFLAVNLGLFDYSTLVGW